MRHLKQFIPIALFFSGTVAIAVAQSVWTARTSGTLNPLPTVKWTGTQLVAVGYNGTVLTSSDGSIWTSLRSSGLPDLVFDFTWTGSQFVAVGALDTLIDGAWRINHGLILTSPDGVTWTRQNSGTIKDLHSITWTGRQLVIVGQAGTILTSPDGITWTPQNSGISDGSLWSVTWTGSQLVVVGTNGASEGGATILTSPDGKKWTSQNSGMTGYLFSVIWSGTQLVTVGASGKILTSTDGVTWTARNSGTTNGLFSTTWTGTQFVAVGATAIAIQIGPPPYNVTTITRTGNAIILTSSDGVTWTARNSGIAKDLHSVTWTGPSTGSGTGQLVAVGDSGAILASQDPVAMGAFRQTPIPPRELPKVFFNGKSVILNEHFMIDGTSLMIQGR